MMWAFPVVPEEPVDEFLIEAGYIIPHEPPMVPEELFIYSSVEPFHMGIHLGRARVGMEMREMKRSCRFSEVEGKL